MLLGDIPARHSRVIPNKVALVCGDERVTWADFHDRTTKLAHGFLHAGLQRGDKVAIVLSNRLEYLETLYALAKAGMVAVVPNTMLSSAELCRILNDSDALAVVTEPQFDAKLDAVRHELTKVETIIGVDGASSASLELHELRDRSPDTPLPYRPDDNDHLLLPYTSGTTGFPKGVVLTHRNCCIGTAMQLVAKRFRPDDVGFMISPLFFIGPLCGSLSSLMMSGCTTVLLDFQAERLFETIQRERATVGSLVPSVLRRISLHPALSKYDLSSLRSIFSSGSPVPIEMLRHAIEVLGPVVQTGMGMTETSSNGTMLTEEQVVEHVARRGPDAPSLCSIGRPMNGIGICLLDDDGEEIPFGSDAVGEIALRGDGVMQGYWKQPEATSEVMTEDGWFRGGDLASRDDDGFLYIVDRKKDIIISGGINVFPSEIEICLAAHPAVEDAAVIGVPDETWGETIKAVVVRRDGHACSEDDLIAHCRERLASYKKPTSVDFVDEMPRSATGKILKRSLRNQYWGSRREQVS